MNKNADRQETKQFWTYIYMNFSSILTSKTYPDISPFLHELSCIHSVTFKIHFQLQICIHSMFIQKYNGINQVSQKTVCVCIEHAMQNMVHVCVKFF